MKQPSRKIKISVHDLPKHEVESCLKILVRSFEINSIAIRKSGDQDGV
ncbi:unnamed protein product [marine sediment metagenome]|uniref:Uncharacterized protein n=1 Tax=marine sediment metagenome TaxID=412755 RepID=X1H1A1_9ZZZZ